MILYFTCNYYSIIKLPRCLLWIWFLSLKCICINKDDRIIKIYPYHTTLASFLFGNFLCNLFLWVKIWTISVDTITDTRHPANDPTTIDAIWIDDKLVSLLLVTVVEFWKPVETINCIHVYLICVNKMLRWKWLQKIGIINTIETLLKPQKW